LVQKRSTEDRKTAEHVADQGPAIIVPLVRPSGHSRVNRGAIRRGTPDSVIGRLVLIRTEFEQFNSSAHQALRDNGGEPEAGAEVAWANWEVKTENKGQKKEFFHLILHTTWVLAEYVFLPINVTTRRK